MNIKLMKEWYEIKEKMTYIGGIGSILKELENITDIEELKEYIVNKTKKCWDDSMPLAKQLCDKNIELAKDFIKKGDIK